MWYKIYLLAFIMIPVDLLSQATVGQNTGVSTDYLGWNSTVTEDLLIETFAISSQGIGFKVGSLPQGTLFMNGWGMSMGTVGILPPLHVHLLDVSDEMICFRAETEVPNGSASPDITKGGEFIVRADGDLNIGVDGFAESNDAVRNIGIYAKSCPQGGKAFTVYGEASGSISSWAGWFEGDVYHSGSWPSPSDQLLKTNIEEIVGSLELLEGLNPKKYEFRTEEFPSLNLSEGVHYGFIAQDVEAIFPELVKIAKSRIKYDDETMEVVEPSYEFLSLNYIGLIPIILDALKERQELIDSQLQAINEIEAILTVLEEQLQE